MQVPSTSNKFYKNSLPAIISTRSKLQKVKRRRKKVIIFKVKNKHWRPWPRWKRRRSRRFLEKRKLVKRWGNFKYYKNLYRYVDGYHNSYWVGKLVNGFIKEGKKHTVERQILNAFVHAKTQINHNALEVLLDSIERVKPILNLGSYVKSGKKIEYPVLLKSEKRRRIALQNIMKLTKVMKERRLYQRVLEGLVELTAMTEEGKHDLKENRDELFDLVSAKGENLKQARNYLRGR